MSDEDYRGVWPSEHDYIAAQIAEHLPEFLSWLPCACDPVRLRDGYCGQAILVWSRPLGLGQVMIFERACETPR